jgi:cobalt-precorrin 5A hydrolase/precorrin-3B C17-methyltransferase
MIGLISVTAGGRAAAERLAAVLPYAQLYDGSAASALPQAFAECDAIISFLAVGATVRIVAPLITGKYEDPGIVCVDEALRYAIPVLGGHAGGANVLARRVAGILGATAVITTAAEAAGSVGLDEFGADLGFVVEPSSEMAPVGAAILSGERVTLTMGQQWPVPPLPPNVVRTPQPEPGVPAIVVSDEVPRPPAAEVPDGAGAAAPGHVPEGTGDATGTAGGAAGAAGNAPWAAGHAVGAAGGVPGTAGDAVDAAGDPPWAAGHAVGTAGGVSGAASDAVGTAGDIAGTAKPPGPRVTYRPPSLVVGVGASTGVTAGEAGRLIDETLAAAGLSPRSVRWLATADIKAREPGLLAAARQRRWAVVTAPAAQLATIDVPTPSEIVRAAVGTPSVAEAAALLVAEGSQEQGGPGPGGPGGARLVVTKRSSARATVAVARLRPRGRLALIGLGPGARDLMAPRAVEELRRASVVVGLDQYVDQVADLISPGAQVLASSLGEEEQRAGVAVSEALAGRAVALIGSGDVGIYAMASPALALADERIEVVGVPGVTAALAAGAVLGAPLGHDHAIISLSDLHTEWAVIERRVRAVAEADLVTCFYNPVSRTRNWQLGRALAILAGHRPPETPVGWVRDASRPGQYSGIATLAQFDPAEADMHTLVVVGSSRTTVVAGRMVTPRDYRWAAP